MECPITAMLLGACDSAVIDSRIPHTDEDRLTYLLLLVAETIFEHPVRTRSYTEPLRRRRRDLRKIAAPMGIEPDAPDHQGRDSTTRPR